MIIVRTVVLLAILSIAATRIPRCRSHCVVKQATHSSSTFRESRHVVFAFQTKGGTSALQDSQQLARKIDKLESSLETNPKNDDALNSLKQLIWQPRAIEQSSSNRIRELLRRYSYKPSTSLTPADEPGEPMIMSGKVRNEQEEVVAGALVYAFQTDARGYYTPTRAMDEANARLFGNARTDSSGWYELQTIRPGGYPQAVKGLSDDRKFVPQHVHLKVTASGYQDHTCNTNYSCQIVFADDPRMTSGWHKWAEAGGHPVLEVTREKSGIQRAVYDIVLKRPN